MGIPLVASWHTNLHDFEECRLGACSKRAVYGLYIHTYYSELPRHRPRDTQPVDVRG